MAPGSTDGAQRPAVVFKIDVSGGEREKFERQVAAAERACGGRAVAISLFGPQAWIGVGGLAGISHSGGTWARLTLAIYNSNQHADRHSAAFALWAIHLKSPGRHRGQEQGAGARSS